MPDGPFRTADDERDAQPWLQAIRLAPFDDARPSRDYAAWLQERGYRRGEHLALACERWRYKHPARFASEAERFAALEPTAAAWFDSLRALGATDLTIRRGMVVRARLEGASVANVEALLRREPISELVLVCTDRGAASIAAASESLATLRSLTLRDGDPAAEAALLGSRHLGALHTIEVTAHSQAIVTALTTLEAEPSRVAIARLGAADLAALVASPLFGGVDDLALTEGRFDDDKGAVLARLPRPHLRRLDLSRTRAGVHTLNALLPQLRSLSALDLGYTDLAMATVDLLLRALGPSLSSLGVAGTRDAAAIAAILRAPLATQLTRLDLRGARYTRFDLLRMLHRSKLQRTRLLPALPWESDAAIMRAYPALRLGAEGG